MVYRVLSSKFEANWSRDSWVMIGQTEITTWCFLFVFLKNKIQIKMVEFSYPSIFEVLISKTILFYMKFNNLIFLEKFRLFTICLNIPGILKSFIYVGVPGFQSFIYSAFQFRCHTSHFLKGLFRILQCALCFLQKFRTFKILSVILHICILFIK